MIRLILFALMAIITIVMLTIGTVGKDTSEPVNVRKWALIPGILTALFFFAAFFRVIGPGEVGIPVTFGNAGAPLSSGIHVVNPFADVQRLSVRTESYTMSIAKGEGAKDGDDSVSVLGSDGAQGSVDATVLYHLDRDAASTLFKTLGSNYVEKIVRPTARTCIRSGFATTGMVEAATTARGAVADDIEQCIVDHLHGDGIVLEQFQLRDVHLSKEVQIAVDAKVKAQQSAEQQRFELAKSTQEAEIARVEAQGRADAQQIIACGGHAVVSDDGKTTKIVPNTGDACQNTLTDAYLQYLYIQSLEKISESDTNSTVILPFDQDLTPLLNAGK